MLNSVSNGIIARNTFLNMAERCIPLAAALIAIPLLVQGLGIERYGLLALFWIILGYFSFLDFGIGRATTKFLVDGLARNDLDDLLRLGALAQDCDVADCVEFRGYVPDEMLPALFSEADLFVMPSWREGFGIVFLEALACGTPVIAGNRDGSMDAVLDGRLGLLVDPEDSSQIETAICSVLEGTTDAALRDSVHLRQEMLAHYGFDQFSSTSKTIVLDLLGAPRCDSSLVTGRRSRF